jgi:hypothetical protein
MLLHDDEKNILTGILGTVAVHLFVLIIFLIARLDKVRDLHQESIVIEFDEEVYKTLEELMEEKKTLTSNVKSLSQEDVKNIAVNTASQIEEKISTEKYIEQIKEELNIDDLNQQQDRSLDNEISLEPKEKPKKQERKQKNTFYKGPTRISFFLENRTDRYIHIPVYKCQGNGTVVVNIIVNQLGEVISATLASTSTDEECVIETAIESASISLFSSDPAADPKQRGTISYEFVAQ